MSTPVYLWRIPDALIGKLEGLKPPRVALVSLHLGAFSFPESETMFPVSNHIATPNARTMSSREISELVESRHDNVKRSMETLRDGGLISFTQSQETSHDGPGARPVAVYLVNKRDSYVVVAQLSPAFTARLVDRWQELEARAMLTHSAGGVLRDELEAVDVLARILNVANSGKLGMVRASLAHHGAAHLLPTLPVYAIDAPTTATSAPASSMPTASLTVLLNEHDIGVSAVTANKMLARAGMLEEMTRPSSKGTVKKFWSVTEAGQKYGKNVTSPSNQKETQPHWYRDTFKELVRLHLVA